MALQYPLLFPDGEDGFHEQIPYQRNTGERKTKRGDVTMNEYYAYIVQQRKNQGNTLLKGGHLFQQYLVDVYTTVEEQRLKWTRNNQDTLRVDLYHNLCDAVTRVVYVIEFQKRGLPYAHILLWLEERWKCRNPAEIDDIISVELPSPIEDPEGYKVVTEYMLHGPCGADAKYAPYITDGKCSKHFPKSFLAESVIDEDGYALYRRRNNKVTAKKGKFVYDNKHVVPYNRYLLIKYQAHINVEWCNMSKAIKYLIKYLNKGLDRATVIIQENVKGGQNGTSKQVLEVDEIKNFQNCRFLAPCEAVWRLFSYDIHYSYPTVMQLSFHLPD
ncbi:ATP-dependent DNA helicase PIF1 [Tanacetum coccineum]